MCFGTAGFRHDMVLGIQPPYHVGRLARSFGQDAIRFFEDLPLDGETELEQLGRDIQLLERQLNSSQMIPLPDTSVDQTSRPMTNSTLNAELAELEADTYRLMSETYAPHENIACTKR